MSSTGYLTKSLLSLSRKEKEPQRSSVQGHKVVQVPLMSHASPGTEDKKSSLATHCKPLLYPGNGRFWLPMGFQFIVKVSPSLIYPALAMWPTMADPGTDQGTGAHNAYFTVRKASLFPLEINQQFLTISTAQNYL